MVIPDSDVWIDYFKNPASPQAMALDALISLDEAALVGIVVTEVLRGARTTARQRKIQQMFEGVDYVETSLRSWTRAGIIAAALDAEGTPIPLPDAIVAAVAIEEGHELFTRDKHFERIPGLRLYRPEGDSQ